MVIPGGTFIPESRVSKHSVKPVCKGDMLKEEYSFIPK